MVRHAAWHLWRLREADDENLGLAFSDHGSRRTGITSLTSRIKHDGQFVVRHPASTSSGLLSSAYRFEVSRRPAHVRPCHRDARIERQRSMPRPHRRGPSARSRRSRPSRERRDGGDGCFHQIRAMKAAATATGIRRCIHAQARRRMLDGSVPTGGSADEPLPVRTAQNDNPAQRSDASTKTNDDWVRLPPPPHTRIDELADLLEWIANAKPEDEATIRAEINRYYFKTRGGSGHRDLQSWLSVMVSGRGTTKETRQKILNIIEKYSWNDPADVAGVTEIVNDLPGVAAGLPPATAGTRSAEEAARQSRAATEIVAAEIAFATNTPSGSLEIRLGQERSNNPRFSGRRVAALQFPSD